MNDSWAERTGLTAVMITVPELADFTHRWRSVSRSTARPHVPLTELVPPHVTVLVPWVIEPTEADVRRLSKAVAPFDPFELSFLSAGQFPNGTVWLRPEPFGTLVSLMFSVFQAFPECPPYGGEFPDPHPHLTISSANQGGPAVLAEAQSVLAETSAPTCQLTELELWREDEHGVWGQFGAVPLGAR